MAVKRYQSTIPSKTPVLDLLLLKKYFGEDLFFRSVSGQVNRDHGRATEADDMQARIFGAILGGVIRAGQIETHVEHALGIDKALLWLFQPKR